MVDKKQFNDGLKYLRKQFGEDAIMSFDDAPLVQPAIPTGHPCVDAITGIGGFPRGKITEIFGWESTGKSTLALHAVASEQRLGGSALYVDVEHAFSKPYAERLGVNLSKESILVTQPSCAEEALSLTGAAVDVGLATMVIVDSTAALTPKAELDGTIGDHGAGIASQARLMSEALRQLNSKCSRKDVCLIFINQIRNTIGATGYGPKQKTTGGNALKFYASLRLELKKMATIKGKLQDKLTGVMYDGPVGAKIRMTVVKNKCAPPFNQTDVILRMGYGFDIESSILEIAVAQGKVEKSGAWYSMNGERLGQGAEQVRKLFQDHPDILASLVGSLDLKTGIQDQTEIVSMDETVNDDEQVDIDQLLDGSGEGGE